MSEKKNAFELMMGAKRPRAQEERAIEPEPPAKTQKTSEKDDAAEGLSVLEALLLPVAELTSDQAVRQCLRKVADTLLNRLVLVINEQPYRLLEIEFYVTMKSHPDPYTHCAEEQKSHGQWYFHRSSAMNYRSGSYKGLDITIGHPEAGIMGGVLIRSIQDVKSKEVVCGPSLSVDRILQLNGVSEAKEMVAQVLKGDISVDRKAGQNRKLYLAFPSQLSPPIELDRMEMFSSARVGIFLNKPVPLEVQKDYCFGLYRFLVRPNLIKKGRHLLVCAMHASGIASHEIVRTLGSTTASVTGFIQSFERGKSAALTNYKGARLSDQDLCEAIGCCHASLDSSGNTQQTQADPEAEPSHGSSSSDAKSPLENKAVAVKASDGLGTSGSPAPAPAPQNDGDGDGAAAQRSGLLAHLTEQSWIDALKPEFSKPYFKRLEEFLAKEEVAKAEIFPPKEMIFAALNTTPVHAIKAVIIGQDPYHDKGQAHGLCFSVQKGCAVPPSLVRIYKELQTDIPGFKAPKHGCLTKWAENGVLMLNATLTVKAHTPNSHKDSGWQEFTDAVIRVVNQKSEGVAFLLWGKFAQKKASFVDKKRHHVVNSPHPSPLGGSGWFGCRCFSSANHYLQSIGKQPVEWALD